MVDRYARTQAGIDLLVELAETLQAPVIDQAGRMNFPTRHPLNQSSRRGAVVANADVIMGLEATDFWNALNTMHDQVHRTSRPIMKSDAKLISITTGDLYTKANYQDFYRYAGVDLAMAADAEATLPSLIEETKRLITADRKRALKDRGAKLASAHQIARWNRREPMRHTPGTRVPSARAAFAPSFGPDQGRGLVARFDSQALQLVAPAAVAL